MSSLRLCCPFALAVVVRLGVYFYVVAPAAAVSEFFPFLFPDSLNFYEYSLGIAESGKYIDAAGAQAWRMPAYSFILSFIAPIFEGGGIVFWLHLPNIILGGVNAVLAMLIGRRLFGAVAGWLAGVITALYPFMVYLDCLVLTDTLAVTAVLLACYVYVLLVKNSHDFRLSAVGLFVLGLVLGGAVYVKASFGLLVIPFAGLAVVSLCQWRLVSIVRCVGLIFMAWFAVIAPWWLRNYEIYNEFVPLSTMGGFTLWEASGVNADGGANHGKVDFPQRWYHLRAELKAGRYDNSGVHPEIAADFLLKRESLKLLSGDWRRTIGLSLKKIRKTWNPFLNWGGAGRWRSYILFCSYVPVLLLAGFALWHYRRRWREIGVLVLPLLYLFAVHAVFMGSVRYRLPAVACLMILAGAGLELLLRKLKRRF